MNQPQTDTPLFKRLRFVLVETSHPGNIGAAARAMKTMGFAEMVLVNPRDMAFAQNEEAIAFASGALDVLNGARVVASIDEALQGVHFAAALSARLREYSPPILSPRTASATMSAIEAPVALVFGNERYGLPNEIVEKCNALINIPANPEYASLNLAQAVQLLAYECRMAASGENLTEAGIGFQGEPASAEQIEGMFAHLEQALVEIDFLDPQSPKKLMPRLKRLFARTQLETEEVNILRGIARQIIERRRRLD